VRQLASIQLGVPADVIETWNLHAGAKPGPAPAHDMNIWLGAYSRGCWGWSDASPMDGYQFALPAARTACRRQPDHRRGRDRRRPISRRSASHLQHRRRVQPKRQGFPPGPPAVWVEQLTELTLVHGVSGYILCRVESGDIVRRFADEVVPAIRNAVRTERGPGKACPRTPIAGWIDCVRGNPPGIEVSDE
jgi:hypothetical protein